jgi:hypothetical protein
VTLIGGVRVVNGGDEHPAEADHPGGDEDQSEHGPNEEERGDEYNSLTTPVHQIGDVRAC